MSCHWSGVDCRKWREAHACLACCDAYKRYIEGQSVQPDKGDAIFVAQALILLLTTTGRSRRFEPQVCCPTVTVQPDR
eukprot:5636892-Pleurochrysis_carterae.AAC.3